MKRGGSLNKNKLTVLIYAIISVALIVLKSFHVIALPWWLVLSPLWGVVAVLLVLIIAALIAAAVYAVGYEDNDVDFE